MINFVKKFVNLTIFLFPLEANSLPVDSKLCSTEDDIQAKMFAAAMARGLNLDTLSK